MKTRLFLVSGVSLALVCAPLLATGAQKGSRDRRFSRILTKAEKPTNRLQVAAGAGELNIWVKNPKKQIGGFHIGDAITIKMFDSAHGPPALKGAAAGEKFTRLTGSDVASLIRVMETCKYEELSRGLYSYFPADIKPALEAYRNPAESKRQ